MTRTTATSKASRKAAKRDADLEAWMRGTPDLDRAALALLTAYADAERLGKAAGAAAVVPQLDAAVPSETIGDEVAAGGETASDPAATSDGDGADSGAVVSRGFAGTLRLYEVAGLEPEQLAALHGRLIAVGCLNCDLSGTGDGLIYRITRDGRRRLSDETVADEGDEELAEAA